MALTSHHHVHPVRRTIGLVMVLITIIALLVATWQHNPLADRIEGSVRVWLEQSGGLDDSR